MTITVFLVVSEASLASCWPAHLRMEAERTERVTGFPIGGPRGGGVDRHGDVIESEELYYSWEGSGVQWCPTASLATTGPNS